MNDADLPALRTLANYQFGRGAGDGLFPAGESLRIERSSSGRPRQVLADDGRLVSLGLDELEDMSAEDLEDRLTNSSH